MTKDYTGRVGIDLAASRYSEMNAINFPLRPNLTLRFTLPTDLTNQEGERLCKFIQSMVRDETNRELLT